MYPDKRNLAMRIKLRRINGNQVEEIRFRNLVTPEPSLNEAILKKRDSGYMHLFTLTRHAGIQLVT